MDSPTPTPASENLAENFTTPLAAREQQLGATMATWFGCTLPEKFSSLETEYRFARESAALIDKNYLSYFELTGPDRRRYLNAILTNEIPEKADGPGVPALLLNPQGHILAELEIYALPGRHLAISYRLTREKLAAELDRYIIMDDVTLDDATGRLSSLGVEGPRSSEILRALGGPDLNELPQLGTVETQLAGIAARIIHRTPGGIPAFDVLVDTPHLEKLWDALLTEVQKQNGGPIGYQTLSTLRLEAGLPWFSYDFDDAVIPHEAGLEKTHISFSKGCYTGQEIVERVRSRGHVNRQRVVVQIAGSAIPPPGTKLFAPDNMEKEAGRISHAAFSPKFKSTIAFAYLRRPFSAPGTKLLLTSPDPASSIVIS
jgi:folate-binding protein YgfZ